MPEEELEELRRQAQAAARRFDGGRDDNFRGATIREIVGLVVKRIEAVLGAEMVVVSLRVRHGRQGKFLRPLYTKPTELHAAFVDPNDRDFDFSPASFVDGAALTKDTPRTPKSVLHLYKLSDVHARKKPRGFPKRIRNILAANDAKLGLPGGVNDLWHNGYCILGGRRIAGDDVGAPFHSFLALHFLAPTKPIPEPQKGASLVLGDLFDILFDAITIFEEEDGKRFQLEGLRLVSGLVSTFMDANPAAPKFSPAHKIQALITGVERLLQRHLLGSATGAPINGERPARGSLPWVRFVKVEARKEGSEIVPELSIYPRDVARMHSVASFVLAHPKSISIAKYLVYLHAQKLGVPKSFSDLFTDISVPPRCLIREGGELGGIVVSSSDTKHFSRLNQDVTPSDEIPTNTVAAFLILNSEKGRERLPFGVLTFESALPDAFADDDIAFLSSFVQACAPLMQHLGMGDSSQADFRAAVAQSFSVIAAKQIEGVFMGEILFELSRMDGALMREIAASDSRDVTKLTGLDAKKRRQYFLEPLPQQFFGQTDEDAGRQSFERTLDERHVWILENQDKLERIWNVADFPKILEFLRSVPSNLIWYSYLSAIPRAIADRNFEGEAPQLALFARGFSALAMFVVNRHREIQQIIKLSSEAKIKEERDRYREFVRYKVPLAARLPLTAFAYETTGENSKDGYGALVSDLVGGGGNESDQDQPSSLLSRMCNQMKDTEPTTAALQSREVTLDAVTEHFVKNTKLWRPPLVAHKVSERFKLKETNPLAVVQQISRVQYPASRGGTGVEDPKGMVRLRAHLEAFHGPLLSSVMRLLESITKEFETDPTRVMEFKIVTRDVDELIASIDKVLFFKDAARCFHMLPDVIETRMCIMHGDLNGKNLTWSDHYERFFIIDFERVGVGFWGSDQLKLAASIIGEAMPEAMSLFNKSQMLTYREALMAVHANVQAGIRFIDDLVDRLPDHASVVKSLTPDGNDAFLVAVLKAIFTTAEMDQNVYARHGFWRYALVCFMYKQFEHALFALDQTCAPLIDDMAKEIAAGRDGVTFLAKFDDTRVATRVASVIYAYRSFLAAIPSRKDEASVAPGSGAS